MNETLTLILDYLVKGAATILFIGIGVLGSWLLAKMKTNKNLKNIAEATEQVINAAQLTVMELQQVIVEAWKDANHGKLTDEQIEELKERVVDITISKLSDPVINLLKGANVDISAIIHSAAEAFIQKKKEELSF